MHCIIRSRFRRIYASGAPIHITTAQANCCLIVFLGNTDGSIDSIGGQKMRKYMGADGIGPPSVAGTGCFEFVRTPAFSGCGDDICSGRGRGGSLQQQRAMSGTSDLIYFADIK